MGREFWVCENSPCCDCQIVSRSRRPVAAEGPGWTAQPISSASGYMLWLFRHHVPGQPEEIRLQGAIQAALRAGDALLVPERPFSLRWHWRWRSSPDRCRRKIEMSPGAQSRNDTPGGEHTCAERHHSQTRRAGEGVKGHSRLAGARSAALEALPATQQSWGSRASVSLGRDARQAIPPQPVLRWHARRFQIVWRPAPRGIVTTLVRRIGRLMLFHHRQRSTQPFVLDNRSGRHGRILSNTRNGRGVPLN